MLDTNPISIQFRIPATDHLGKNAVAGKVRFLPDSVEIDWSLEANVFRGQQEVNSISLSYGDIEHVALVKRWWSVRALDLRISDPALVQEIPGVEVGKMTLEIDKRSRSEAKKLTDLIDFKRSIFLVNEQTRRLERLSKDL